MVEQEQGLALRDPDEDMRKHELLSIFALSDELRSAYTD